MTPKTLNERKTLGGRAFSFAKLRLLSHCAWNYLYPFGLCRCARKKGKQELKEGRKEEQSQEMYISRMYGTTTSGRNPTKLGTCVRHTDVIKFAKFHRYDLRGFGAVRCWRFHVAIGNQGRPLHCAKRYRAAGDTTDCRWRLRYLCPPCIVGCLKLCNQWIIPIAVRAASIWQTS